MMKAIILIWIIWFLLHNQKIKLFHLIIYYIKFEKYFLNYLFFILFQCYNIYKIYFITINKKYLTLSNINTVPYIMDFWPPSPSPNSFQIFTKVGTLVIWNFSRYLPWCFSNLRLNIKVPTLSLYFFS